MNSTSTSYLLWLTWLVGLAGLHRFYNRKPFTGFLWLITWGFFGIGQVIDLFLIPGMVDEHNDKLRLKRTLDRLDPLPQSGIELILPRDKTAATKLLDRQSTTNSNTAPLSQHQIMMQLLKAAAERGGRLSVTQGVLDTGLGFEQVEATLKDMVKTGYVAIENHPNTGVVLYNFLEL
jgi:TM2 domain-containing membrane protein YozV